MHAITRRYVNGRDVDSPEPSLGAFAVGSVTSRPSTTPGSGLASPLGGVMFPDGGGKLGTSSRGSSRGSPTKLAPLYASGGGSARQTASYSLNPHMVA